jgi:hypothetical protein
MIFSKFTFTIRLGNIIQTGVIMSRFFKLGTRTLYSVESYAGALKVPAGSIKLKDEAIDDNLPPEPPKLRRQNALGLAGASQFFSSDTNSIIDGAYNTSQQSNSDLTEVRAHVVIR